LKIKNTAETTDIQILVYSGEKMRGVFEKTPLHPKNFRVMDAAEICKAKDAGVIMYQT